MKIVEPYARMIGDDSDAPIHIEPDGIWWSQFDKFQGIKKLRRVEYAARVSHGSEEKQTMDSYDRFLRSVILQHGDWSVAEHEKVTCEFLVDRGITHEIVRHRISSYTQESTRFINYQKKGGEAKFINPWPNIDLSEWNRSCTDVILPPVDADPALVAVSSWYRAMQAAEDTYMKMLACGIKPQIARGVLPNSLASKIVVTMNLRGWRHFFIMRTSAQAHPQMLQVTVPLLKEFQEKIPILYEDLVPGRQQSEAMAVLK